VLSLCPLAQLAHLSPCSSTRFTGSFSLGLTLTMLGWASPLAVALSSPRAWAHSCSIGLGGSLLGYGSVSSSMSHSEGAWLRLGLSRVPFLDCGSVSGSGSVSGCGWGLAPPSYTGVSLALRKLRAFSLRTFTIAVQVYITVSLLIILTFFNTFPTSGDPNFVPIRLNSSS
jgi:hypothetical protein